MINKCKKILFGLYKQWAVHRKLIANIALILIIIIAMSIYIGQSQRSQEKLKEAQALQIFLRVDDIVHEQLAVMEAKGEFIPGIETGRIIDNNFHEATTLKERYKRAKEMDIFVDGVDEYLHEIGGFTTPEDIARDKKLHEINSIFDELSSHSTLREIQEEKSIEVFTKIYNISLQKYQEISVKKNPSTAEIDEEFPKMQKEYQEAKTLHQKYRVVKKFVALMEKGHDIVKGLGLSTAEDDEEFYELIKEFNETKPW